MIRALLAGEPPVVAILTTPTAVPEGGPVRTRDAPWAAVEHASHQTNDSVLVSRACRGRGGTRLGSAANDRLNQTAQLATFIHAYPA